MRTYPQRVCANILPLSAAGTLHEALKEWEFTDKTIDHRDARATCHLCNQEELRYHYEIRNSITGRTLWVGSKCILKFGVSVFEDGVRLDKRGASRKLGRLLANLRLNACLAALRELVCTEANKILANALEFYQRKRYLTPKFAFVVFWRLRHHRIDHSPSFFKVSLRRAKYQQDLREMGPDRVHLIWAALSSSQRKLARRLGHLPPVNT